MTSLIDLIERYKQGARPVFSAGPFLSIEALRARGLRFDRVLSFPEDMAQAAAANLELGFEATIVPFDMNVEAEVIGCPVLFHEEVDGVPVYPTVGKRWIQTADDFDLPASTAGAGRIAAIAEAIRRLKKTAAGRAAVGAFVPGPFTLAGQVMDPDRMFVTALKQPEVMEAVLAKLTKLLMGVRDIYTQAGADYIVVQEGGATSISPRAFKRLVLPAFERLFEDKTVPQLLGLAGRADPYIPMLPATGADGIGVDQQCDIARSMESLPAGFPLFAVCGGYDMLARETPEQIRNTVWSCLDLGVTQACPPADIYPPARLENIAAFIEAHRCYRRCVTQG